MSQIAALYVETDGSRTIADRLAARLKHDRAAAPAGSATQEGVAEGGAHGATAAAVEASAQQHRDRGRENRPPRGEHDRNRPRPQHHREGSGKGERRRDERRGDEHRRRHDERPSPAIRSASPPPGNKKGAVDPDSPFASLGALRDVLAKQAREKNST